MSTRAAKKRRSFANKEPRKRVSTRYATRSFMKERQASGVESLGPFFGGLPPEMIKLLVSFLDAPALSNLGSTCRLLRSYTETSWKELCYRQKLHFPLTILCVANPATCESSYDYDIAVKLCTSEEKWKIAAKRNWLYSRWRCVVCFRNCSSRVDAHFDIALCDTCHPLFYRRKCHAKEQFSLTEKDLRALDNDSYEYIVSDLIKIARQKYGNKTALEERLHERQKLRTKREAEKQCALVHREREVVRALESMSSSYEEIMGVDARCMPYVSTPGSYQYSPQQLPEDAAKWLIAWKDRQETRHKLLLAEISARASRCKGCRAKYDHRLVQVSKCTHVSKEEADQLTKSVEDNFNHDIAHYSRHGQLSFETGVYDLEHRSAQELFLRNERRMKLKEELQSQQGDWPEILNGIKDPMNCTFSQDYIYKGVAVLDAEGNKCKLRTAKNVARIILAQARGWNQRYSQLKEQLVLKGFVPPFRSLKIESQLLIDDFVDNMIVVRGDHIVACTAVEVANRIAIIQGLAEEEKSAVAERCARIYADCNPRPDYTRMKQQRRSSLVHFMNITRPVEELVKESSPWCAAQEYINCGTTTSLFGYKISTVEATAELIHLKLHLSSQSNSKKRKVTD